MISSLYIKQGDDSNMITRHWSVGSPGINKFFRKTFHFGICEFTGERFVWERCNLFGFFTGLKPSAVSRNATCLSLPFPPPYQNLKWSEFVFPISSFILSTFLIPSFSRCPWMSHKLKSFSGLRNSDWGEPAKHNTHSQPFPAASSAPGMFSGVWGHPHAGLGFTLIPFESSKDTEPQLTSGFHSKLHLFFVLLNQ